VSPKVKTLPVTVSQYQCAVCRLDKPLCTLFKKNRICKFYQKDSADTSLEWHKKRGYCPHYRIAHDNNLVYTACLINPSTSFFTGLGTCDHVDCSQYDDCLIYQVNEYIDFNFYDQELPQLLEKIGVLYPATTKSTTFLNYLPQNPIPTHPFIVTGFGILGKNNVLFSPNYRKSCGEVIQFVKCPTCNTIKNLIRVSCDQQFCPECWNRWAKKQTERALDRLKGYRDLFYSTNPKGTRLGKPKHFVFSPDPDVVSKYIKKWQRLTNSDQYGYTMAMVKLRSKLIKIMRDHGLMGGLIIFHPYRIKDEIKDQLSRIKSDKKYWILIRENALNLPTWQDYVYFSPHFHVISYGFIAKSNEFYNKTGWVYKNRGSLKKDEDIAGCLFYALSHAGVMDDKHTVTWFGSLSYNKMVREREKEWVEKEPVVCEKCGSPLMIHWLDDPDHHREYYKIIVHRKYAFRRSSRDYVLSSNRFRKRHKRKVV